MIKILHGGALETLRSLPAESIHCCVTSPPYWGLRDYGVAGQIGLEATPQEYLEKMVAVFHQVHRVLRKDGTLWLNMGDCYAGSGRGGYIGDACTLEGNRHSQAECRKARGSQLKPGLHETVAAAGQIGRAWAPPPAGFKQKDLVGMPWRLAFVLQSDGWYLRQDIIWHKPNPMPESVRDRCTKAHEYLFLLSKSERYHWDFEAMQEAASGTAHPRTYKTPDGWDTSSGNGGHGSFHKNGREKGQKPEDPNSRMHIERAAGRENSKLHSSRAALRAPGVTPKSARPGSGIKANASFHEAVNDLVQTRNRRSVWTIATAPFKGAHFATFPPKLVEPCILAGCPAGGVVLDPFAGSGTVGQVARQLGRGAILIELNEEYLGMIRERLDKSQNPPPSKALRRAGPKPKTQNSHP